MVPKSPSERQTPGESSNGSAVENSELRRRSGDHISAILLQLLLSPLLQEQPNSGARQHQSKSCINFKLFLEVEEKYLFLYRLQLRTYNAAYSTVASLSKLEVCKREVIISFSNFRTKIKKFKLQKASIFPSVVKIIC